MNKYNKIDVVIIGAGHAGIEAATAVARMGGRALLITLAKNNIGELSCNPAIGGLGKGHIVKEIDALDGLMGSLADRSAIQYRLLNRRKGPAVRGPRAQIDRELYKYHSNNILTGYKNLDILYDEVNDIEVKSGKVVGVVTEKYDFIKCQAVILTTGTFLNGVIHIGDKTIKAGRVNENAVTKLAERVRGFDLDVKRLKTGTPPRLNGNTINWGILQEQKGDEEISRFSYLEENVLNKQISCYITHTNETTHEIIRSNLDKSAMYSGNISGAGPRYCPSIEDKVVRFADKDSHQIFLEPEGLNNNTVYPNGVSTSLPHDVQTSYINSVLGLENAEIIRPGYAIEYDYVDPRSLKHNLELKKIENLFLAGQINGTTGYEEAAGQGLLAGINAMRNVLFKKPFIILRSEGYIGVMVDDLISKGVSEPYRMFTSRAEYRLNLRADNADQRLTEKARKTGVVGDKRYKLYSKKMGKINKALQIAKSLKISPNEAKKKGFSLSQDGVMRNVIELLSYPTIKYDDLIKIWPQLNEFEEEVKEQLIIDGLYSGYLTRQHDEIAAFKKSENLQLPSNLDFKKIGGLSNEMLEKLEAVKPQSIGHASRIEGITSAALINLLKYAKKQEKIHG